jgi:hypothetical protein
LEVLSTLRQNKNAPKPAAWTRRLINPHAMNFIKVLEVVHRLKGKAAQF